MKSFNPDIDKFIGSIPPQMLKYVHGKNIKSATDELNEFITNIALNFHEQLNTGKSNDQIKLATPKLFGQDVKLDYINSGSMASVYKITIGTESFALKINRQTEFGDLEVMSKRTLTSSRLVNKMYSGGVFEYGNGKYTWILSDFVSDRGKGDFYSAMEKMYYMYLTKGLDISDAHPNNFVGGVLVDTPSIKKRTGIDSINNLTRSQIDMVKKLVHNIRIDDADGFKKVVDKVARQPNSPVLKYMFFAMKFGAANMRHLPQMASFFEKVNRYQSIIDSEYNRQKEMMKSVSINSNTDRGH